MGMGAEALSGVSRIVELWRSGGAVIAAMLNSSAVLCDRKVTSLYSSELGAAVRAAPPARYRASRSAVSKVRDAESPEVGFSRSPPRLHTEYRVQTPSRATQSHSDLRREPLEARPGRCM